MKKTALMFSAMAALGIALQARAQQWVPIAMVTADDLKAGISPGGEGTQVIRSLVISPSNPDFMLFGTDVGGIFRTLNGGKYWQVCMTGWTGRGGNSFAIDPKNPKRIVGAGGNSMDWNPGWGASPFGLFLSTDQGASWKQVLPSLEGNSWIAPALAYDPASYDAKLGYCTVAYWESREGGLFKSTDGGATWAVVNPAVSGGKIKVHPSNGTIYLVGGSPSIHGFLRSADGGKTFQKTEDSNLTGIDVIATHPNDVYVSGDKKVLVSHDGGLTFQPAGAAQGLPDGHPIDDIRVSPADPKIMTVHHGGAQWWENYAYFSHDGGVSWQKPVWDRTHHFMPFTQPDMRPVFDPRNANLLYTPLGTDGTVMRSTDGGRTFRWWTNGANNVMQGGSFGFSAKYPNAVFLSFQDFNGAQSQDGGKSWTYCNPSGQTWGGFTYGGFAADPNVMWTGDAPGWTGARTLKVSRDAGKTWTIMKDAQGQDIHYGGPDVSYCDPSNADLCFASNWRSTDRAKTWAAMTNCDAVFTSDPKGAILFGKHGDRICQSKDHGATWSDVTAPVSGGYKDLGYDWKRRILYVASEDRVKSYALAQGASGAWADTGPLPKDFKGGTHAWTVAVDPVNTDILYAAGPSNIFANDASVSRSTDGGKTWANITVTTPLKSPTQAGGPHEVTWVRVHPVTRALWAAGECYGMWKIAPPAGK